MGSNPACEEKSRCLTGLNSTSDREICWGNSPLHPVIPSTGDAENDAATYFNASVSLGGWSGMVCTGGKDGSLLSVSGDYREHQVLSPAQFSS